MVRDSGIRQSFAGGEVTSGDRRCPEGEGRFGRFLRLGCLLMLLPLQCGSTPERGASEPREYARFRDHLEKFRRPRGIEDLRDPEGAVAGGPIAKSFKKYVEDLDIPGWMDSEPSPAFKKTRYLKWIDYQKLLRERGGVSVCILCGRDARPVKGARVCLVDGWLLKASNAALGEVKR